MFLLFLIALTALSVIGEQIPLRDCLVDKARSILKLREKFNLVRVSINQHHVARDFGCSCKAPVRPPKAEEKNHMSLSSGKRPGLKAG